MQTIINIPLAVGWKLRDCMGLRDKSNAQRQNEKQSSHEEKN